MPGKPITISRSEYEVLSQAKTSYEESQGESVDWGRFLLFLLGLFIANELKRNSDKNRWKSQRG